MTALAVHAAVQVSDPHMTRRCEIVVSDKVALTINRRDPNRGTFGHYHMLNVTLDEWDEIVREVKKARRIQRCAERCAERQP